MLRSSSTFNKRSQRYKINNFKNLGLSRNTLLYPAVFISILNSIITLSYLYDYHTEDWRKTWVKYSAYFQIFVYVLAILYPLVSTINAKGPSHLFFSLFFFVVFFIPIAVNYWILLFLANEEKSSMERQRRWLMLLFLVIIGMNCFFLLRFMGPLT